MSHPEPYHSVYSYIGQRIRERRKRLKLSQGQLAELMGFSYQQMQKYETGSSQASVSKLLQFARILNVPPVYFYEGATLDDGIGQGIANDIIQHYRTKPLQVLLVENSSADIIAFRRALSNCSQQVDLYVIHDTEMVGDFLRNHDRKYGWPMPDILLLDIDLPKTSGLQLLKSIKSNATTAGLPVIILTNSISKKDMEDAYRHYAAGFIQKTVDTQRYAEIMEMAMRYWSQAVVLPNM